MSVDSLNCTLLSPIVITNIMIRVMIKRLNPLCLLHYYS